MTSTPVPKRLIRSPYPDSAPADYSDEVSDAAFDSLKASIEAEFEGEKLELVSGPAWQIQAMGFPKGEFGYYPTYTMPTMLDVVWCKFPEQEAPEKPGPKPRPALVRAVSLYRNQEAVAVEVCFGTSKISRVHQLDLIISNYEEMAAAGLPQNTGFRLARSLWLPWCVEFFVPREGKPTPVIGHLCESARMQLEALKVARRGKSIG